MIIQITPHEPLYASLLADEVLQGMQFLFSSGNECVVTPSMKQLDNGECRVNISYAWIRKPSAEDRFAVEAYIGGMLQGEPDFLSEETNATESRKIQDQWLGHGKVPRKVK